MTKQEIISAIESFKDAVSEDRKNKLSEIQAAVESLLEPPVLEEVEALKQKDAIEIDSVAEAEVVEAEEAAEPKEDDDDSGDEKKTLKAGTESEEPKKKRKPYTYHSKFVPKNRVKSKKR